ncbi:Uncharacterized conserved protein [Helicobacter pametensis]|nr:Uncharacterized conserved protein [Helicobacter pametensis]
MVSTLTLPSLAATGFLGSGHCAGMCGGLSTAFALQLPPQVGRVKLIVLMNLGRIGSYTFIGLYLARLNAYVAQVEKLGRPVWRLNPL